MMELLATGTQGKDILSDQEKKFLEMVKRGLVTARGSKITGKLSFIANLQDGGMVNRYTISEIKDK